MARSRHVFRSATALLLLTAWQLRATAQSAEDAAAEQPAPSSEAAAPAPEPVVPESTAGEAPAESAVSAEDERAIQEALQADRAREDGSEAPAPSTEPAPVPTPSVQSMNPDLSFIADFALAYFSSDENYQTGAHDPTETGFNLQQLELSVGSAVDPYFRFDANLVFSLFGVELEEAYATTLSLPERLQLRAGQFLTRFGRINATHPHAWDFVDQPFEIGRVFGPEGNRGLGVELSWLSPLPWYVELLGSATEASGEATARSFFGAEDLGVETPLDVQYTLAIKQFFPLDENWSLAWGLSNALGPNSTGRDNRTEVYGTDLYLKWRPITFESQQMLSLHLEWLYRRRQVPDTVLQDTGGFAAIVFRFAQRWAVGGRYEYGSPAVDTGFDTVQDYLDPEWDEGRSRYTVNTTFWPTEFSRLRLQSSLDVPGWADPVFATFLALEVVTGAHGSHPF
jgi:hypothetical protein